MNFLRWFKRRDEKSSGVTAENIATEYLLKNHYRIVERNYSCKLGEIDIIAEQNKKLIFVEVKYRKNKIGRRTAKAAVNKSKQKKIILAAKWYLQNKFKDANHLPACRFDVITVEGSLENPDIELYTNAFLAKQQP